MKTLKFKCNETKRILEVNPDFVKELKNEIALLNGYLQHNEYNKYTLWDDDIIYKPDSRKEDASYWRQLPDIIDIEKINRDWYGSDADYDKALEQATEDSEWAIMQAEKEKNYPNNTKGYKQNREAIFIMT